ncbi:MAG: hypothetical protein AB7U95_11220, partial [Reyranella sp.]
MVGRTQARFENKIGIGAFVEPGPAAGPPSAGPRRRSPQHAGLIMVFRWERATPMALRGSMIEKMS